MERLERGKHFDRSSAINKLYQVTGFQGQFQVFIIIKWNINYTCTKCGGQPKCARGLKVCVQRLTIILARSFFGSFLCINWQRNEQIIKLYSMTALPITWAISNAHHFFVDWIEQNDYFWSLMKWIYNGNRFALAHSRDRCAPLFFMNYETIFFTLFDDNITFNLLW